MASSFVCALASDCSGISDGVVRDCFENPAFTNRTFVCDCSLWFGWTGESCDEATSVLTYNRIVTPLLLSWGILVTILSARTIYYNFLVEGIVVHSLFLTSISIFLATICVVIFLFLRLFAYFDSTAFQVNRYTNLFGNDFEDVDFRGSNGAHAIVLFSTFFNTFASLFLMLSWEEVVTKISKFQSPGREQRAKRKAKALKIFGHIYFVVNIIVCLLDKVVIAINMVLIVNFIVSAYFLVASGRFITTLDTICQGMTKNLKTLLEIMSFVRQISLIVVVCLVGANISSMAHLAGFNAIQTDAVHGQFHYVHFMRDVAYFFALLMFTTIAWYVNSVTNAGGYSQDSYSSYSCIFKWWDAKSRHLLE